MNIEPIAPEEWAAKQAEFGRYTVKLYTYNDSADDPGRELFVSSDMAQKQWSHVPQELMQQAAAFALHGQTFGFTWEDVDALRETVQAIEDEGWLNSDAFVPLLDLADRIEAILPPRETT